LYIIFELKKKVNVGEVEALQSLFHRVIQSIPLDAARPVFADPLGWKKELQACILRYSNLYATLSVTIARVLPGAPQLFAKMTVRQNESGKIHPS
jgi:hypothetical protein